MLLSDIKAKTSGREPKIIDVKRANAILIPLVETEDGVCLLFETRSMNVWQPGEVCLPGGGIEQGETVREAAVRECCEELGIQETDIEIIEDFDILIGMGNFVLYSVIGIINTTSFKPDPNEVDSCFTVPVEWFLSHEPKGYDFPVSVIEPEGFDYSVFGINGDSYSWRKGTNHVLVWRYEDHYIWGLTAKLIYNFVEAIR